MRKLLAVTISACLLALVLAVPALAAPMDPPNSWGQAHSTYDKSVDGPLGQTISAGVHDIKANTFPTGDFRNYGDFTQWAMDLFR